MRVHTKTLPTNNSNKKEVEVIIKDYDYYMNCDEPMPSEVMTQEMFGDRPRWSICFAGLRGRECLTQKEFGKLIGIDQSTVSKIELAKREIGKKLAHKLAKIFNTDYRMFL